jgi:hypothetical protein
MDSLGPILFGSRMHFESVLALGGEPIIIPLHIKKASVSHFQQKDFASRPKYKNLSTFVLTIATIRRI